MKKAILLIRLQGALQSWSASVRNMACDFPTEREPTHCGVVGMIAYAMGRKPGDDLHDLASCRFGVRVEKEGQLVSDYHAVKDVPQANYHESTVNVRDMVTLRHYLSDADFLAGLEGPMSLLRQAHEALGASFSPLWLGRRSCPPATSPWIKDGLIDTDETLEQVLANREPKSDHKRRMIIWLGPSAIEGELKCDFPVKFNGWHDRTINQRRKTVLV